MGVCAAAASQRFHLLVSIAAYHITSSVGRMLTYSDAWLVFNVRW
jgi:hypothetical protein